MATEESQCRGDDMGDRMRYHTIHCDVVQELSMIDTMTELRVSPKGVSHSAEKRFENTGSSRSSNTDLKAK